MANIFLADSLELFWSYKALRFTILEKKQQKRNIFRLAGGAPTAGNRLTYFLESSCHADLIDI